MVLLVGKPAMADSLESFFSPPFTFLPLEPAFVAADSMLVPSPTDLAELVTTASTTAAAETEPNFAFPRVCNLDYSCKDTKVK